MSRPLAWVTGAGGLIGSHLIAAADQSEWDLRPLTRGELDIADHAAVRRRWERDRPDLVIHCAAITRAVICEQQPDLARQINVDATRLLVELAAEARLIYVSTDLVFDGCKGAYYSEDDAVNPVTFYGETKALAEKHVLANPHHLVIRTSLNAGRSPTGDRSFAEDTARAWANGKVTTLFTDEYRCPIGASVTAKTIWMLARRYQPGIFHLAGSERLSRWEIGNVLAELVPHLNPRIQPALLRDYTGPRRAPNTSLDTSRLQAHLGIEFPRFSDWARTHRKEVF